MPRRRPQFRVFDLVMWVVLAALAFAFGRELSRIPQQHESVNGSVILICCGFGVWVVVWLVSRTRRTGPVCEQCGRRFLAHGTLANSTLCARCRPASLPPAQSRRELRANLLVMLVILTALNALILLPLWSSLVARFGGFAWIVFLLLALGATLSLGAGFFLVFFVLFLIRNWRLRYEKNSFALARKCSGQEGTIERTGPLAIWWCGTVDPVPMLMDQMATGRERFERLVDEPVDLPAVRVLVFDTRRAFVAYHGNLFADMSVLDCIFANRPARTITVATEITRFRVHDHARSIRAGFVLYFLEAYKRFLAPNWLQLGISGALAHNPGGDDCARLNRRMRVSLDNGKALVAAELFQQLSTHGLFKLVRAQADHDSFARFMQFRGQCWSVVEYLIGSDPPPDRLGRFRSFLSDLKSTALQEAVFQRHFGRGYAVLLEGWRTWVLEQAIGADAIPPPDVRSTILEQLVPAIRDGSKKAQDRIQAMRALGSAGYPLGAHSLIDTLREGDERFTATAAWALEAISGLAFGSDAQRWGQWWAGRDSSTVDEFEFLERR